MTKLTLSVDEAVVEKAKRLAQANDTSVSAMFSEFVQSMSTGAARGMKIGPLTRKLTGIMKVPAGKDYKDLLAEALLDRHGMGK
jgi:hypothetical protein